MDSYEMSEFIQVNLNWGPLTLTLLLGFTTFLLLLWSSIQKQRYWKTIGIPYVKPYPFVGCFLENLEKPFHDSEFQRYQKYGRIYGHYEGNRALLSVGDPELLRHILVKDFHAFSGRRSFECGCTMTNSMLSMLKGEDWKRVRTIITPTFTTGKLKKMMDIFKECSSTLVKNFKEASVKGESIEVKRMYGAFSMDIIASAAFSTKIDSHNDPSNLFVAAARNVFTKKFNWRVFVLALAPGIMKYFKIGLFPPKSLQFFSDTVLQIIEERKRTKQTRNDFLQILMDTAEEMAQEGKLDLKDDDDITTNYGKEENKVLNNYRPKKFLSQEELVAQCVIFFLAGYDTTSSTLSFASYQLALNPEIQERLIQEIDEVRKSNDGELTYEGIQSMKYLDNVISETMRIFPPGIRLEREADEDYKLCDTGLTVAKGVIVTVPVYAIHRDPELFPDPEKFDPDRFTPEERAKRSQYAYIPFGAGPRNCVGMRFALIQIKVCLAHVLSHFRIKRCPQTKVPLEFYKGQAHMEPKNVSLFMEERQDKVE